MAVRAGSDNSGGTGLGRGLGNHNFLGQKEETADDPPTLVS